MRKNKSELELRELQTNLNIKDANEAGSKEVESDCPA